MLESTKSTNFINIKHLIIEYLGIIQVNSINWLFCIKEKKQLMSFPWTMPRHWAFDSVVHSKLLYKLSCYGVCDMVLDWLKDVLNARMQCVRSESCLSTYCAATSGVSQGSVLGPVLIV